MGGGRLGPGERRRAQRPVQDRRHGGAEHRVRHRDAVPEGPGLLNPLFKKMMLPYGYKVMAEKPKRMVDTGKLGEASGEGFCTYR